VLACVFAAAVDECHAGGSFTDALGICGSALRRNIERYFPGTLEGLETFGLDVEPTVNEDEKCLRELLWRLPHCFISNQFTVDLSRSPQSHTAKPFMAGSWTGKSR
jgi:hypothetical protein